MMNYLLDKIMEFRKDVGDLFKFVEIFKRLHGHKYRIELGSSKSCVVSLVDAGNVRKWFVRFDKAHGTSVPFDHINIQPSFSGLMKDPHLKLPPGGLKVAEGLARLCKVVNRVNGVVVVMFIAVEAVECISQDYKKGTMRNIVSKVGDWTGNIVGATVGAQLGTAIFPVVGTVIFGLSGGIVGRYGGDLAMRSVIEKFWPQLEEKSASQSYEEKSASQSYEEKSDPQSDEEKSDPQSDEEKSDPQSDKEKSDPQSDEEKSDPQSDEEKSDPQSDEKKCYSPKSKL